MFTNIVEALGFRKPKFGALVIFYRIGVLVIVLANLALRNKIRFDREVLKYV